MENILTSVAETFQHARLVLVATADSVNSSKILDVTKVVGEEFSAEPKNNIPHVS